MHPNHDQDTLDQASRTAILSLVFGILGSCTAGLASIAGLALGIETLRRLKGSEASEQRSVAIAGVTLSCLTLIGGIGSLFVLIPMLTEARAAARQEYEQKSLENVGRAISLYAVDNADRLPSPSQWMDDIAPYFKGTLARNGSITLGVDGHTYAMNAGLEGKLITRVARPERTVLVFECAAGSASCGGAESFPATPRDAQGFLILFLDGHAEQVPGDRVGGLIWDP